MDSGAIGMFAKEVSAVNKQEMGPRPARGVWVFAVGAKWLAAFLLCDSYISLCLSFPSVKVEITLMPPLGLFGRGSELRWIKHLSSHRV